MRKIIYLLAIVVLIMACNGAQKAYENGQYDTAIKKAVKKLRKNSNDAQYLRILEESFINANRVDNDRINYLKKENRAESSAELFQLYTTLKNRQNLVKTSPAIPNGIEFKEYDDEILNAKKGAAQYRYDKGNQLLVSESHYDARAAYQEFLQVKTYYSDFQDVDKKIEESKIKGISNVNVELVNNDPVVKLPTGFEDRAKQSAVEALNSEWIAYYNNKPDVKYYYIIRTNITSIAVTPERIQEKSFRESKEIKDGWEYKKDKNGKELKDSLGVKIKVDKYKTVYCNVKQETRVKKAVLKGFIEYHETGKEQPIKSVEFISEGVFTQLISVPNGDMAALSDETKKTIGVKELPFPLDEDLILLAADDVKIKTYNAILENKALIK